MTGGYFELGSVRGIPIRLHWTAFVVPFLLGGLRGGPWFFVAFATIVLAHELGHAFVARARGLRVLEIALHGLGGHCRHSVGSELDEQSVAWGGVLAQAWLGLAIHAYGVGTDAGVFAFEPTLAILVDSLNETNLRLALFNLLPIRPLDGHEAWKLFGTIYRGVVVPPTTTSIDWEVPPGATNPVAVEVVSEALERARRDALSPDGESPKAR